MKKAVTFVSAETNDSSKEYDACFSFQQYRNSLFVHTHGYAYTGIRRVHFAFKKSLCQAAIAPRMHRRPQNLRL